MKDAGIDYGMGQSNRDHKTGIHYGVIHSGRVGQAWYDESEPDYGYPGEVECPACSQVEDLPDGFDWGDVHTCHNCGEEFEVELLEGAEAVGYYYTDDGYACEQHQDDCDIFVTLSPYYTLCSYCSPCAPGAGYLEGQNENGIKAYCLGHDWFEGGRAPYRVFDVKTGKEVLP